MSADVFTASKFLLYLNRLILENFYWKDENDLYIFFPFAGKSVLLYWKNTVAIGDFT